MGAKFKVFQTALAAAFIALLTGTFAPAQTMYKWVDDQGNVHFADTPAGIPPKYRNQVVTEEFKKRKEPAPKPEEAQPSEGGMLTSAEVKKAEEEKKLKRYEIPYKAYEGTARRIIIPVRFNNSITVDMVLDTGAPGLVISPRLAEKLGLFDKKDGLLYTQAGGIGGTVPAALTIIDTLQVGDAVDHFIPTTITPSISGSFEGLVGMDFMSNFSVTINTQRRKLILEELPPSASRPGGHDEAWWKINFYNFAETRKDWEEFLKWLKEQESSTTIMSKLEKIKLYRGFAERQYTEADKLFSKLDNYASRNSVPMNWRKY
ncbi:MAG: aspartyl protease family protein [Nitrospinae bacterium]|nr:aspartyl protease family protein [Nitrospinota bacterium]